MWTEDSDSPVFSNDNVYEWMNDTSTVNENKQVIDFTSNQLTENGLIMKVTDFIWRLSLKQKPKVFTLESHVNGHRNINDCIFHLLRSSEFCRCVLINENYTEEDGELFLRSLPDFFVAEELSNHSGYLAVNAADNRTIVKQSIIESDRSRYFVPIPIAWYHRTNFFERISIFRDALFYFIIFAVAVTLTADYLKIIDCTAMF